MSIQAVAWALDQDIPNSGLKLVLIALCNHADKGSGELFLRHKTVEKEASMSRSSVQRHVKTLADMGIIEIGSTFDPSGRQSANSYRIIFSEAEQREVASARSSAGGYHSDTLHTGEEVGGEPVRLAASEGVTVTSRDRAHAAGEGVNGDAPNTNRPLEPSSPLPPSRGSIDNDFEELVRAYPPDKIGDRSTAERAFKALSGDETKQAIATVKTFVRAMILRGCRMPRLSMFLSERRFVEFYGAPDIDRDGEFVITPDRPEWGPWLGAIRDKLGESGVQTTLRTKYLVRKTRWPADLSLAQSVTNLAPSVTEMATDSAARG